MQYSFFCRILKKSSLYQKRAVNLFPNDRDVGNENFALNMCRGFSYFGISLIKQYCMLKPFKGIFKSYSRKGLIINKSFANFRNITQYANYNDLSFEV